MESYLLDTHIWIWLQEGKKESLSLPLIHRMDRAIARQEVFASTISIWEMGTLIARKRLQLTEPLDAWIASARDGGLQLLSLDTQIAIECTRLPGEIHRDPADRMLVAAARVLGLTLVTVDERILAYGRQGYVKVMDK